MATAPHPRDIRKPPFQDAEHFIERGETKYGQTFFIVPIGRRGAFLRIPRKRKSFRCPGCGVEIPDQE